MHNILSNQNKSENILRLAAQRQIYKEAKQFFIFQLAITVPLTIIFSFLKMVPKDTLGFDIVSIAAFFGAMISIADILISYLLISEFKSKAAKIQEEFDCNVYEMEWDKISVGKKPSPGEINKFGNKYKPIPGSKLEDWYPNEIAAFSKEKAIYTCQKTNIHYDRTLRDKFVRSSILVSAGLLAIIFIGAIVSNPSLDNFISQIFFPFLPILIITLKIFFDHRKSIRGTNDLHGTITGLNEGGSNLTMTQLRCVQTNIFNNRKDSPLVPDFFYNKKRNKLEIDMHINARA